MQNMAEQLGVACQRDDGLTGERILIPYLLGDEPLDRYLERMKLRSDVPGDALTSINEAYVEGYGWCNRQELHTLSNAFGYYNPEYPRVSKLSVAFAEHTESGNIRVGFVDVAPSDFKQMKGAYGLEHEATHVIKTEL